LAQWTLPSQHCQPRQLLRSVPWDLLPQLSRYCQLPRLVRSIQSALWLLPSLPSPGLPSVPCFLLVRLLLLPRLFLGIQSGRLDPSPHRFPQILVPLLDQYSLLAQWGQLHLPNHSTRQRQSAPYSRLDLSPQLILRSLEHQLDPLDQLDLVGLLDPDHL
jgi:hypothetical protein